MEIGVREAAQWFGVSERRVQVLAQSGRLPARMVAGAWLIDTERLGRPRARSRPMSPRIAEAFVRLLSRPDLEARQLGINDREHFRLRARVQTLLADDDPASLLAAWTVLARGDTSTWAAHASDLPQLLRDDRLVLTGVSDPRADLAVSDEVDAWVDAVSLGAVVADHLLVREGPPNVTLHVTDEAVVQRPVPLGRLLVDLSAHPGPREAAAVHRLLHESHAAS